MKYNAVIRGIEKTPLQEQGGRKEKQGWIIVDDMKVLHVTWPKKHGSDVKKGTVCSIAKQLKLKAHDFAELASCHMSTAQYETHIRKYLAQLPQ